MKPLLLFLPLLLHVSCLTSEELAAFTPRIPGYTDINTGLQAIVSPTDNGDGSQTISMNGIPSHATYSFPAPGARGPAAHATVQEVPVNFTFFKEPIMRACDNHIRCLPEGVVGYATSGTGIFSWWPKQTGCPYVLDTELGDLDLCNGHPTPEGDYHYHDYSPCVQQPTCGQASTIWGVAIDGIPIYGPWDEDGR